MEKEIKAIIANEEYCYYGLRILHPAESSTPGDVLRYNSYRWADGEPTGELLKGVSCVGIGNGDVTDADIARAITLLRDYRYLGDRIAILGSDDFGGYGADVYNDEIILRRPTLLGIVDNNL